MSQRFDMDEPPCPLIPVWIFFQRDPSDFYTIGGADAQGLIRPSAESLSVVIKRFNLGKPSAMIGAIVWHAIFKGLIPPLY